MFSLTVRGRLLLTLLLIVFIGTASPGFALNFNAFWLYRERGGEDRDPSREFQQNYTLGVGPSLTFRPTHAISARFFLNYSQSRRNLGNDRGWVTVDQLTPSADLSLTNDIFYIQLGGYVQTSSSSGAESTTNRSWDVGLGSTWQIPLWPSLNLNYGERTDDGENVQKYTSAGLDWDLILARLNYQYTRSESEDDETGSLGKNESHFARFETRGRFWQDRLSFNLSQQAQYSTGDFSIGDLGEENLATVPGEVLARVDQSTGLDPADLGYVDPGGQLPLELNFNQKIHILLDPDPVPIDLLRLTLGDSLAVQSALDLQWSLFTRRDPLDPWQPVVGTFQIVPSMEVENGIEIRFGNSFEGGEILLVAENALGSVLTFSGLHAFRHAEDARSTRKSYLTNLSAAFRPARNWQISSSLTAEGYDSEAGGSDSDFNRLAVSGSVRWSPTPYLTPALNFSEVRQEQTNEPEQMSRSYGLTVSSIILPTLQTTLGATRTERYSDDEEVNNSNSYSLVTTAQIYPDLSAGLFLNYRNGESRNADGRPAETDTYSSRLTLNARINRALTSDLTVNYVKIEAGDREDSSSDSVLGLLYRPSELLALGMTATKYWIGENTDSVALFLRLRMLQTRKTRLEARVTHRQADDTSDHFGLDWSWEISRALSLQTRANYNLGERYSYNLDAFLTLRL